MSTGDPPDYSAFWQRCAQAPGPEYPEKTKSAHISHASLCLIRYRKSLHSPGLSLINSYRGRGIRPFLTYKCGTHFMRNIMVHVPQKDKKSFAAQLKEIWLAPFSKLTRQRAEQLSEQYGKRFSRAIELLEDGLENSLPSMDFRSWMPAKFLLPICSNGSTRKSDAEPM